MALTPKERKALERERRKAEGYETITEYVPTRDRKQAIDFIKKLRGQYEQDKLEGKA